MDLMRTLLIYMSATMALAVQNTTAPKVTPVPTPAPEAIVETVETPAPGEETVAPKDQTAKPESTVKITPAPVPTITPNMKAYHNLAMGAKGKEVRKLQEKLIEMGYLEEGSADGAYGRKTYNAVKKFQHYNGLTADGIAGRKTQTNLFENPEMLPNPEAAPATESPDPVIATPEITKEPEAEKIPEPAAQEAADFGEPESEALEIEETAVEEPAAEEAETEEPGEEASAEGIPAEEAPAEETPAEEAPAEETPAEETPETAEPAADEKAEDETELVEEVDLDADTYELINASVALNEGNGPLEYIATEDGVPVPVRPRVSQNGTKIRISLDDLCKCVEKWQLTDDGVGSVVLEAAGYTLVLYNEDSGTTATLDGAKIPVTDDDIDFVSEGHFVNAEFLAGALKGSVQWDQEENTLMLRIRDKEAVESED